MIAGDPLLQAVNIRVSTASDAVARVLTDLPEIKITLKIEFADKRGGK
jgi:hypothetical protein